METFLKMSEAAGEYPALGVFEASAAIDAERERAAKARIEVETLYREAFSESDENEPDRVEPLSDLANVSSLPNGGDRGDRRVLESMVREIRERGAREPPSPRGLAAPALEEIGRAERSLAESIAALNRIKLRTAESAPDPKLLEGVAFERGMEKICRKILRFDRYVETVKTIEALCERSRPSPAGPGEDPSPPAIARLLREVESALLYED